MNQNFRVKKSDDLHYLPNSNMHPSDTYFHFSFASYYDPTNMNFGLLRVLNDDAIVPHTGFDKHPHKDMQIVSYIVAGELTHWDNLTNQQETIGPGHVQVISAGSGVWHSEKNLGQEACRILQIWILPPFAGGEVRYTNKKFEPAERKNQLLHIVGNPFNKEHVPLYINSDANIYVSEITDKEAQVEFTLAPNRQAYINCIEGVVSIEGYAELDTRDSLEINQPDTLTFSSSGSKTHFIIIEMAKQ